MGEEPKGTPDLRSLAALYSPRLKTAPKIDTQLKMTAKAQPISPTKNITSSTRRTQTEKVKIIFSR